MMPSAPFRTRRALRSFTTCRQVAYGLFVGAQRFLPVSTTLVLTPALPSLHTSLLPRPQELVGGSAVFEPFFKSYIQRFSGTPLTSDDFRAFFCEHFKDVEAIKQVDWDTWFYQPGGRRDAHVGLAAKC